MRHGRRSLACWGTITAVCGMILPSQCVAGADILDVGSRRELFVDDSLIDKMTGVELRLHSPVPKEVAIVFDAPWEGNTSAYVTVFRDGNRYRMYYRGSKYDPETGKYSKQRTCYAESADGKNWTKPSLGLIEYDSSKENNIVWDGVGSHNFTPFKDENPDCPREAKYKALATGEGGLVAFRSPDGIHWRLLQQEPVIAKGAFDSQNLAFWDPVRGSYIEFHRGFRDGVRDIMTSTSEDFIHWTEPVWLDYGDAPAEHLYTNAITPYYRASHILMGFPKRFLPERKVGGHPIGGVSDGVFMTSRDGVHWHRWLEAFIRPGLQEERWVNRNNMTAWGILETDCDIAGMPKEICLYSSEGYYQDRCRLRRYTLRLDGFVSAHAGYEGGEILTKPLVFAGDRLYLNYSTSAAGSVQAEMLTAQGHPIEGFRLEESVEKYGDEIEGMMSWEAGADVGELAGQPIRIRLVLEDADIYAIRFGAAETP
jgi:hypothetical protein